MGASDDTQLVLERGRIVSDIAITQPRPRSAERREFQLVRAQLLQLLGVEVEAPAEVIVPPTPRPITTPFNFSNFSI